jgi:hypothetical protein
VSTPIGEGSQYVTLSPYSSMFTSNTWSGLRFFRAQITHFSTSVTDYVLTDFGVLHEVFPQTDMGNLSMGVHVYGLGAWNFR